MTLPMSEVDQVMSPSLPLTRRSFLRAVAAGSGIALAAKARSQAAAKFTGQVGITTSSLFRQNAGKATDRNFELWDTPRILRDELDMRVIDINTGTLGSKNPAHLDRFRRAVADAGCVVTNVKVNATHLGVKVLDLPFDHPDREIRLSAVKEYKEWILAAQRLGARWLRPFPSSTRPNFNDLVEGYRELADFAAGHDIRLVVENTAWISSDAAAIPKLVDALGGRISAAPDIGAWEPAIRFEALARAFPHAVTCDFKVGKLGPGGEHKSYDLKRCFDIGWKSGFRGPWCIEHANDNTAALFKELRWIKSQIEAWTREASLREPGL